MTAPLYTLRNLTQDFGPRRVLDIPHLDIEAGGLCALLGPNGAGKTTLLKILAFLEPPGNGEILFQGRPISPSEAACLRPRVVLVPQFPIMFTGSLRWNVEFPMRIKAIQPAQRKKRALELLDRVGLAHLAEAPAHRLSGGESRRAATARALAAEPEVLLLDEPTANVDARSRDEFIELIRTLHAEGGLSVIMTTHDPETASRLCTRYIHLEAGRPVQRILLADGGTALPARCVGERHLQSAEAPETEGPWRIFDLSRQAAGVVLRLETPEGRSLRLLVEQPDENMLALRLADVIRLSAGNVPKP